MRKSMDNRGEKNGMYGYQYTPEQLKLKSDQGKGKIIEDYHKEIISESMMGNDHGNKAVDQYDLNDNFIKSFDSRKHAAEITGADAGVINRCINGKNKTSFGYKLKSPKQ